MDVLGPDAARKLGESAVCLKVSQEQNAKVSAIIASMRAEIEAARQECGRLTKKEDVHHQNKLRLLHALRDLNNRIAQQAEEARLLGEEKSNVAVKRRLAEQRVVSTRHSLENVNAEIKEAERQREEALLVAERARTQYRSVDKEKTVTDKEKKATDGTLKRLRVSTEKCSAANQFVQALLE